ncbi:MAG: Coenzyme F420 hydrogenase/dehydrogenase, beta subunit C-terminal domain [Candidatus Hodarchaeota archaeon]
MNERNNIKIIIDNDLCISCGGCTYACPFKKIVMKYNAQRGKWEAEVKDFKKCTRCYGEKNCLRVCPSYKVDYMKKAYSDKNRLLGNILKVYNGYSKDFETRNRSSSGGFIRELCKTLFKKKEIDGVISISHVKGLDYEPNLIKDVSKMPNSIYHNINFENAFRLLINNTGKFLIIGLPCQLTSISLLSDMKKFLHLKDRIYAKVSLICGYIFDRISAEAFAYYNNIHLSEISYRENGRFRKTRIFDDNKKSLVFNVLQPKSSNEFINNKILSDRFLVQNGCLHCVDHLCYTADLVVGDAWQKRYQEDRIGTNIIIIRTDKGQRIINEIENIYLEEGYIKEIIESQSELYALGALGEAMNRLKISNNYFCPQHLRTTELNNLHIYKFKTKEILKIRVVKKLLRKKRYLLAKNIYLLLHLRMFIIHSLQKLGKR